MNTQILLVEDNPLTRKGLTYLLEREHYSVVAAPDLNRARQEISRMSFDLVLLDITLPDGDGLSFARELRAEPSPPPIIFLTARDDELDVVSGLELGAEDYITKPFRNRELLLRIRNVFRRYHPATERLEVGQFSFNYTSGELFVAGREVMLTALERKLFICLLENADHVVTRERLLDEIWSASGKSVNDNTLSVYLKRLREKLGSPGSVETIKQLGYRLKTNSEFSSKSSNYPQNSSSGVTPDQPANLPKTSRSFALTSRKSQPGVTPDSLKSPESAHHD